MRGMGAREGVPSFPDAVLLRQRRQKKCRILSNATFFPFQEKP